MCNGFYNRQGASERELIRNTFTANQRRQGAEYDFNQPIQVPDIFFGQIWILTATFKANRQSRPSIFIVMPHDWLTPLIVVL